MFRRTLLGCASALVMFALTPDSGARTQKPPLHGQNWVAITGKPLAATAGARIFERGGNAVDAACAMIAATSTMWDTLSWGGETQALIYNPNTGKVIGVNALGVAPSGATAEFFRQKGMKYPPEDGPLSAVTPGTPGGIMVMLAEYGTMSLAEVLAPAIALADGYPIEAETANRIEATKAQLKQWPDSKRVMLPHQGAAREAPQAGEIFRQPDLAATLRKLVAAERAALAAGKDRKSAILAAYDRFYRGDVAADLVEATRALGGLFTRDDLAKWQVKLEEPVHVNYKGLEVYKLTTWVQGPAMLQALNILENFDLQGMGFNSARYIHTVYQAMSLAFADRDFYYGDPYFPPAEPVQGLLSKEYARAREAHSRGPQRPRHPPRRPLSVPGRRESLRCKSREMAHSASGACVGTAHGVAPRSTAARVHERHHLRGRCGQGRLGRVGHTERWLGPGRDRGPYGYRTVATHAELRARP